MGYTWKYYDLVLIGVGLSMLLGGTIGLLTSLSVRIAVSVAGLVAILIMAHGMFVNGPVDEPEDLTEEVESLN
ncbi:hypothetical protein G9464_05975 [Halostella sp. JP-L12]|uniref:hypothetical protein n=1 Tax=Halostella TaxID=1843185 RepID=UPI000EF7FF8A|nr:MULTISPECIES: hypothetical protein [Halostella]NHN47146.1 hypothetical protein [Halostella sp. JP-L12]